MNHVMELSSREVELLLSKDTDQLLIMLATDIEHGVLFANEEDKESAKRLAAEWLNSKAEEIRGALCENKKIQALVNSQSDNKLLFVAIFDLMAEMALGVPITTLAAVLVKIGLSRICSPCWSESDA